MFRRWILWVLLVGYLAGQVVAVPYAHATMLTGHEPTHASRTHLHSDWLVRLCTPAARADSEHGHPHSHDSDCPCHEHDHHENGDHDRDSVYLPDFGIVHDVKAAVSPASHTSDAPVLNHSPGSQALVASLNELLHPSPPDGFPPEERFAGCQLFLKLRTLRI